MSIKADTRHTMKNPGSCPGCYEDDRQYIETEEYGDDHIREIRRSCEVCGTRWEEVHSTTPDKVEISRDPQERFLDEYLVPAKGTMAPTLSELINFKSPAGKYLAAKIGRKATRSGTPSAEPSSLEAAWFGGTLPGTESVRTAHAGSEILWRIIDRNDFFKLYRTIEKQDEQSADLLQDVVGKMEDALKIKDGEYNALNKVAQMVKGGQSWDIGLLRNNIFKAADLMGMRLPSGMFASQKTASKLHKQAAQKVVDGGPMNQAIGHKLERCLEAALQMAGSLTPASQSMRPKDMGHGDLWMVDGLEGTDGSDHFFEAHVDISWTGRLGVWHVSVNHPQRGKSQDKGKYDGARKMKDVSKAIADAINQLGGGR